MRIFPVLLSVLFITGLSASVVAEGQAGSFTIGAKGGLSIPNLTAGDDENPLNKGYSSRLGADVGVYFQYRLTDIFSASLGAEYCAEGGKKTGMQAFPVPAEYKAFVPADTKYLYADYKSEAKLDYFQFPLLARAQYTMKSLPVSVYAAVGPFVGILMKAEQETRGSSMIYLDEGGTQPLSPAAASFNADNNISSDTQTYNFGVAGFVGVAFNFSRYSIFVEGGGNYGFVPIQKSSENGKNYTGAAVITVGCSYTFGD